MQRKKPSYACSSQNENILTILPSEIILYIFSYLTPEQLAIASLVSKQFNAFSTDNSLWRAFLKEEKIAIQSDNYKPLWIQLFGGALRKIPAAANNSEDEDVYQVCSQFWPENKVMTGGKNTNVTLLFDEARRINCFLEFYESDKPYILRLYFREQKKELTLCAHYITREEVKKYSSHFLPTSSGVSIDIPYPGEDFAKHLHHLLSTSECVQLGQHKTPLEWFHAFLNDSVSRNKNLIKPIVICLIESFRGIEYELDRLHEPVTRSRCLLS